MTKTLFDRPDRIVGALAALLVQAALLYLLVIGLSVRMPLRVAAALKMFRVSPAAPLPPERRVPHRIHSQRRKGAASPPDLRAKATAVVAPSIVVPPPVVAAPVAGVGHDPIMGAAPMRGPGTGGGGQGDGTGGGSRGGGDGDGGDGGDGGVETPPRWISGEMHNSDYPAAAGDGGFQGTVSVRYTVTTTGQATDCQVSRSSGNRDLDATTCRLIEQRFRYEPARDAAGRPVRSIVIQTHDWAIRRGF